MRGIKDFLIMLAVAGFACWAAVSAGQERLWRSKIRSTLFVPEKLPTLDVQVHGRFHPEPGVIAERISYNTLLGLRVPAIVYRPESPKAKMPGLIVVNGHGGDKYTWYANYSGMLYARAGAAVLTYDPIGEGERNIERKSGTRAHDVLQDPPELGRRMGGLMMSDVMQAVSYLSQRPDVDPARIGAMGYSMGSFVLSLACAVEPRLHACVLAGGGNLDGPRGVWDRGKPMCQGIPYRSLSFLGDRPAVIYALHASRGPTLAYNGLQDTTVSITTHGPPLFADLRRRTAALRGSEAGLFETQFTTGAHRPYFVTKPVALWLEKQLDFPNWTDETIAAMPVTHISEWAKANGVELDRLYASEEREGGTPALATGVPALSRSQLSVFTPEQWEKQKNRLIYEAWLAAARKQLKPGNQETAGEPK
ncbi:MAG TPA: prolyl oligopeptidase family serine peptidase [Bryobacteraceae bacterium]|nr:prolyl oligopeptidase family serine peptidase [Bryobacteraceae bacterium]